MYSKVKGMLSIYFAGDVFDHKHLAGNQLLAEAIERQSHNKYQCNLPQQLPPANNASDGRNQCLAAIIRADIALFNFDGTDIDSGTAVEFIIAKMLDIPSVIVRTDFRNGAYFGGENWNFMASRFPRCKTVSYPVYQPYRTKKLTMLHAELADLIITALDDVMTQPSLLCSKQAIMAAYQHVIAMCGDKLDILIGNELPSIIQQKTIKKLYHLSSQGISCSNSFCL